MPSTDRDELRKLIGDVIVGYAFAAPVNQNLKVAVDEIEDLITQKQKEAQLHILQKVNTIRKGESASVEVIAKHVTEELIAFQSPDREEDKR